MARSSTTGVYTAVANSSNPAVSGDTIDPTTFNALIDDIQDAMNSQGSSAGANVTLQHYAVLTADYALTDTASAQKALNASSNGALTLSASTSYFFEAVYYIINTGTNSHTWSVLFGGTATFTSIRYRAEARTGTTSATTLTAVLDEYASAATELVVKAASTSATENVIVRLDGTMRINGGGTVIPQIKLSATTGGSLSMLANSYFRCWPIGTNTVAAVGNWS